MNPIESNLAFFLELFLRTIIVTSNYIGILIVKSYLVAFRIRGGVRVYECIVACTGFL